MYLLQEVLQGKQQIKFRKERVVHSASEKKYITSIDLILICLFVKEIKENRELFSRLKESDIDSFISDIKSTSVANYSIPYPHPGIVMNEKPHRENSLLYALKNSGYACVNDEYYDCFDGKTHRWAFSIRVKSSEIKRIIYQLLASDTFTNEGVYYVINTSDTKLKKPVGQQNAIYLNVGINQDIPIIPGTATHRLTNSTLSNTTNDIAGISTFELSKETVNRLRKEFSMNWTNVETPFDREFGVVGHFLKVIDPSVPFKPNSFLPPINPLT